jgi:hypothetical protein
MPNHHDLPSASPRDDASEASIFDRFPRPQKVLEPIRLLVPTKAALLRACTDTQLLSPPGVLSTEKTRSAPPPPPTPPPVVRVHPDRTVSSQTFKRPLPLVKSAHESKNTEEAEPVSTIVLGYLTQDGVEWAISAKKQRSGNLSMKRGRSEVVLFMVKQLERHAGLRVERILEHINHRNIAKVTNLAWEDNRLFLGIEYCRFTLKEILHVHRKLEEPQIRYIACSMFNALSYLAQRGIVHHSIGLHSIRVVVDDFRIVLSEPQPSIFYCNALIVIVSRF